MNTNIKILHKIKSLGKRQVLRISLGVAVFIALILILWPNVR
jgi:hypothetical protein